MIIEEHKAVDVEDDNDNEGLSWLPICILNDVNRRYEEREDDLRFSSKRRSYDKRRYRPAPPPLPDRKSSAAGRSPLLPSQHSNNGLKPHSKPRYPMAGGPGMQAIFLQSGRRSSGTGVFLPHVTTEKDGEITKKPVFAPILLPARVVQVLNLNVHALSAQKKPRDIYIDTKHDGFKNKKINKTSNENSKIFLPKEWPY
ncbi:uncharacterized protein LOC112518749 isoform X1 [Cynara cardunculus var. scolymus]|uniref:uncharacterized protein LOC112518749 isoform X1 n=1 Tax=Cynara cardunculus var. scolymus TaxID=59895 RepID=UPI000D6308DC|nr:uncharacterized protein LOC112518749 isoform X1 [Cynara cardunculus var. scolymus]XP_024982336.1 uncharacterized protein LOC112518749 isoform X1 [Cynara cardunculus var. scolymus]